MSYIHRIGRTGRAGRPGKAITYFTEEDKPLLRSIAQVSYIYILDFLCRDSGDNGLFITLVPNVLPTNSFHFFYQFNFCLLLSRHLCVPRDIKNDGVLRRLNICSFARFVRLSLYDLFVFVLPLTGP